MLKTVLLFAALASTVCVSSALPASADALSGSDQCTVPASTLYSAPAEMPQIAALYRLSGRAGVQIDLDKAGNVIDMAIAQSTGDGVLDEAALSAARASKFAPEIRNCAPVAGSYLFVVDFSQE